MKILKVIWMSFKKGWGNFWCVLSMIPFTIAVLFVIIGLGLEDGIETLKSLYGEDD